MAALSTHSNGVNGVRVAQSNAVAQHVRREQMLGFDSEQARAQKALNIVLSAIVTPMIRQRLSLNSPSAQRTANTPLSA